MQLGPASCRRGLSLRALSIDQGIDDASAGHAVEHAYQDQAKRIRTLAEVASLADMKRQLMTADPSDRLAKQAKQ